MPGFNELKSIGKILQEAGKIEQYKQILEIREKLLEMQEEIEGLKKENKELRDRFAVSEDLEYENNVYWVEKNESNKDGPFCSRCWDADKKLIRMHPAGNSAFGECPNCKTSVQIDPGWRPRPMKTNRRDSYI